MAVIRKCVCCGREYEYCPNCSKQSQPAWKVSFCSDTCKDLFNMVSAYNTKRIGKAALQAYVAEHGIDASRYTEPIRRALGAEKMNTRNEMVDTPVYVSRRRKRKNRMWSST